MPCILAGYSEDIWFLQDMNFFGMFMRKKQSKKQENSIKKAERDEIRPAKKWLVSLLF